MSNVAKIKELALENIVLAVFALITLLLLVIWQAVPSSVWATVSEATPKRALWALLGLEAIAICVLVALALDNRRKHKLTPTVDAPTPEPPRYFKFHGLFWDDDLNPVCPADRTLLFVAGRSARKSGGVYDTLRCPSCANIFPLRDRTGVISLAEAQESIQSEIDKA